MINKQEHQTIILANYWPEVLDSKASEHFIVWEDGEDKTREHDIVRGNK